MPISNESLSEGPVTNAFESLCKLSSDEQWCWRLFCRTCRHINFRFAFREIARGKHPLEPGWVVYAKNPFIQRGGSVPGLGPVPLRQDWSINEQAQLVDVIHGANLLAIASVCRSPDWLGYLGLALHYTEDAERRDRILTLSWGPQLIDMTLPGSRSERVFRSVVDDPTKCLTWERLKILSDDPIDGLL